MAFETVETQGPADENAGFRAKAYAIATTLIALLGLGVTLFGLSKGVQQGGEQIIQGVLTLIGALPSGVAARNTSKQVKNGTFDKAPTTPVLDAFQSINAIKTHVDQTVAEAESQVGRAVDAIQGAVAMLPGGTLVTNAVLSGPVGDFVQAMADQGKK